MIYLRSIIFQVYFFASVCFFALLIAIFAWLPYTFRFFFARTWGRSMLWVGRWLCGLRYRFEGLENIPDEASVVLIKHSTVFETYAQLVVFPPHAWVLKRELNWIPMFGWGLAAMRPIAIDRKAGHSAVNQVIEQGKKDWPTAFGSTYFLKERESGREKPKNTASVARPWPRRPA